MNDGHKNSFVNLLGLEGAIAQKKELLNALDETLGRFDAPLAKRLQRIIDHYFKR
jgi:farnesyl diphosphate synthase